MFKLLLFLLFLDNKNCLYLPFLFPRHSKILMEFVKRWIIHCDKQAAVYKPVFDIVAFVRYALFRAASANARFRFGGIPRLSPSAVSSRRSETLLLILITWCNNARARMTFRGMWSSAVWCRARQEKRSNFTCNGQFALLCCIEIASGDQWLPWCELPIVLRLYSVRHRQIRN